MTNTLSFYLSEDQMRQECTTFFDTHLVSNTPNINDYIQSLSVEQFGDWFHSIGEQYYTEIYKHITALAKHLRNGYDPLKEDSNENDPLHQQPTKSLFQRYKAIVSDVSAVRFETLPSVIVQLENLKLFNVAKQEEKMRTIKVEDQTFFAVSMCEVLWSGWECDSNAWVVNQNNNYRLVTTDHGTPHFTDASFLEERIQAYKDAIEKSENMLALLKGNTPT